MKRNILHSIVLLGALALASCSTTNKLASTQTADDDVYFTKAEAGDAPVYRQQVNQERYINTDGDEGDDEDYYYYDSYASRINRFGYNSPFDYYDDYYYGYNNPYGYGGYGAGLGYGGLGYGYGGGWNIGLGFGYGGGYGYGGYGNPWGYGFGGGYGLGGYYSPYSYWGTGYGYGGGYWGTVSANNVRYNSPRPARVSNTATGSLIYGNSGRGGIRNAAPMFVPNRPSRIYGNTTSTGSRPSRINSGSYNNGEARPAYRPSSVERPTTNDRPAYTPPSNSGGGRSGGGGNSGSGGGGGRPGRP